MGRPASSQTLGLTAQRACDACRSRKIRCDRAAPCSPCRAANLTCRTETERTKVHKHRVQVSKQYESKIDSIDHRLATIEQLLRQSTSSVPSPRTPGQPTPEQPSGTHLEDATAATLSEDDSSSHTPATGYIGAQVESIAATGVLEHTIGQDPAIQQDAELMSALQSLRSLVEGSQFNPSTSRRRPTTAELATGHSGVAHPGWKQVQPLLKRIEGTRLAIFSLLPPGMFDDFCRKCRTMYERGQDSSPSDKLLIYSGLSNVCSELTSEGDKSSISYNHSLAQAFAHLLLKTLAIFPLLVPATTDTLEAFLMTILTLLGMCKPSLAWSLTSQAAQMCQKLGYNRLSPSDSNTDLAFNRKVVLFWAIYIMDRNISFRLGHAPAIQDYDISTPVMTENELSSPFLELMTFWMDSGRVQGKICTQLYGPAASSLTPEERARTAQSLADELERIYLRKSETNSAMRSRLTHVQDTWRDGPWLNSDEILYLGTLTTALYAIPSPLPGHLRAIEAARQCLRVSRNFSDLYLRNIYEWSFCCHWVFLHAPLTTFTGIFYNIIKNPFDSREDEQLLEDFVASLEPARQLSEPIEKFYQLCSAFIRVCRAYVRAKAPQQGSSNLAHQVYSQAPQPDMNLETQRPSGLTINDFEQQERQQQQQFFHLTQSLQDWYSGNASLYGLLEQDFSDPSFDFFGDGTVYG